MKKYILFLGLVCLLVIGCVEIEDITITPDTEEDLCLQAGGEWRQMPNACVDSCESQREDLLCAQVLTFGCDCGEGMCWNGESCEVLETMTEEDTLEEDAMMEETAPQSAEVDIRDFAFDPATVTISAGGTITWTNYDSARHTATSDETGIFDSGLLSREESWSHTFEKAGIYNYHCTPHPYMEGTVIVK